MAKGILGQKVGMTQVFQEDGTAVPVTVIMAGPCHVLQIRTLETDGYEAVQLGFLDKPRRLAIRSERGHVAGLGSKRSKKRVTAGVELPKRADCEPKRFIREIRGSAEGFQVGQEVTLAMFDGVARVDVIGTSKGSGFTGAMKRHNFSGQRATHGVKKVHRHPGGTGCSAFPSRTMKGRRMAGQYGSERVTSRNVKVVRFDLASNLLLIHGAVPGPNGGYVIIHESNMLR
ncbi:MAG: 50S ribosomal protein L3 [Planctomycetota bacterium]|nr:50S ribosomal protein L3 [Planctomycetota bacterium]